jgi:hypothetical protein
MLTGERARVGSGDAKPPHRTAWLHDPCGDRRQLHACTCVTQIRRERRATVEAIDLVPTGGVECYVVDIRACKAVAAAATSKIVLEHRACECADNRPQASVAVFSWDRGLEPPTVFRAIGGTRTPTVLPTGT